ncbi:MAG TPA: TMEM175 family protein [Methanoregulaceae archaeon]|nr:TMEM175 family protein [Methanoregulaceae archaeon]
MKDSDEEGPVSKTNVERLTNAFFGFTMTLLIRNLAVPDLSTMTGGAIVSTAARYLVDLSTYLFVFLVLAVSWVMVFRVYRNIVAVDRGFVVRVFVALLLVVFLPVTSQLDTALETPIGGVFAQVNILLLGVMTWSLFRYAARTPSLRNARFSDPRVIGRVHHEYIVVPVLSSLALVLSLVDVPLAGIVYLAAPFVLYWTIGRDGLDP